MLSGGQTHRASEWAASEDQLREIVKEATLRGEGAKHQHLAEQETARQR